jgi:protease IV
MTASDIDNYFDREKLRKSRRRWRIFGILAVLAALAALASYFMDRAPRGDQIARLNIRGIITGDEATLDLVKSIGEAENVKAVIVRIDSPGGTTVGSEALYDALREAGAKKPLVAVMDSVAASGGYITALATDHIIAKGNTITGSIGVIFSYPDVSRLLDTVGVKMEEVKSGEFKAQPTPYKVMDDRVRQITTDMVMESYAWFLGLVVERRAMTETEARLLADGRVYSGRQAVKNRLIDSLGGEIEAVAWLETEKKVEKNLKIVNWAPKSRFGSGGFGFSLAEAFGRALGLPGAAQWSERSKLDGLLVLWHP